MDSFQAIIGWKRMRNREIKIFVPFHSYPTHNTKFIKNSQKIQNIKKIPILQHFWRKLFGKGCEWVKKKKFSFRSVPSRRVIENSIKIRKKFKKN